MKVKSIRITVVESIIIMREERSIMIVTIEEGNITTVEGIEE